MAQLGFPGSSVSAWRCTYRIRAPSGPARKAQVRCSEPTPRNSVMPCTRSAKQKWLHHDCMIASKLKSTWKTPKSPGNLTWRNISQKINVVLQGQGDCWMCWRNMSTNESKFYMINELNRKERPRSRHASASAQCRARPVITSTV